MKRITLFFICFCFCAFLLNCCSDSPNPVTSDTQQYLLDKLGKPRPAPPIVEYLKIDGKILISNGEVGVDKDCLIDFKNIATHTISYKVTTNTSFIEYVHVWLYCDVNLNNYKSPGEPNHLLVLSDTYNGQNLSTVEKEIVWDGKYTETEINFTGETSTLYNELATYDTTEKVQYELPQDHYGISISASGQTSSEYVTKYSYFWILTEDAPLGEFFVSDLSITFENNAPVVNITVINEFGGVEGVYIRGNFRGIVTGWYTSGPTNSDGEVSIVGPRLRKQQKGDISFTVERMRKEDAVYNPWKNNSTFGKWPIFPTFNTTI